MPYLAVNPQLRPLPAAVETHLPLIDDALLKSEQRPASIAGVVAWSDRLSTLAAVIRATGLNGALDACGALTLLAPTDEAFAQLPEGRLEALMQPARRDELRSLLLGHITPGRVDVAKLRATDQLMTPRGTSVRVRRHGDRVTLGDAAGILWSDLQAANGVIHLIDRVLLPAPEKAYVA